jgi:hypothetical protein
MCVLAARPFNPPAGVIHQLTIEEYDYLIEEGNQSIRVSRIPARLRRQPQAAAPVLGGEMPVHVVREEASASVEGARLMARVVVREVDANLDLGRDAALGLVDEDAFQIDPPNHGVNAIRERRVGRGDKGTVVVEPGRPIRTFVPGLRASARSPTKKRV